MAFDLLYAFHYPRIQIGHNVYQFYLYLLISQNYTASHPTPIYSTCSTRKDNSECPACSMYYILYLRLKRRIVISKCNFIELTSFSHLFQAKLDANIRIKSDSNMMFLTPKISITMNRLSSKISDKLHINSIIQLPQIIIFNSIGNK